jgi:hypothetical protein
MSVTNFEDANIAIFKLQSGGAAYDITLPFEADCIEWWNNTVYATNTNNLQGIWFPGMTDPVGGALIISRGTTDLSSVLETSNGVTELSDGSGFADNHRTPTAIDGTTGVVTSNGHGLVNGQYVRATDFRAFPVAKATGMYGLNNLLWQVGNVTTNTFQLFYPQTNMTIAFDPTGETAFVNNGIAQFTLVGESLNTQNPAPVYQYTLGSAVMGADNDIIFVRAMKANVYTNLGDVA